MPDTADSLNKNIKSNEPNDPDKSTMPAKPASSNCYTETMHGMVDSIDEIIKSYECQNKLIKEKCDHFKKTFGMKEPKEIRDSMTENLSSMLSVLEGVRDWFADGTNQLGEVTLDESRLRSKKTYNVKNEVTFEIPDVEDIPLVESDDIHHRALNCLKVIINHLSCTIQEMRFFKNKLQKIKSRMEWSLDINTVYVFEVDKRIKSIVSKFRERLDEECELIASISQHANRDKNINMDKSDKFANQKELAMPGKPISVECYMIRMHGMVDSIDRIIKSCKRQNAQIREKCDIFEKSFGMKTPMEIRNSMTENLLRVMSVLEGERDWFTNETNQLCQISLDGSRPKSRKSFNWRNVVASEIPDVEDILLVESDDIHYLALNSVKVVINHLSGSIQEMQFFKSKLQKIENRMEWSFDLNPDYIFEVDKRIKSIVFKIRKQLDEECEFIASISQQTKENNDNELPSEKSSSNCAFQKNVKRVRFLEEGEPVVVEILNTSDKPNSPERTNLPEKPNSPDTADESDKLDVPNIMPTTDEFEIPNESFMPGNLELNCYMKTMHGMVDSMDRIIKSYDAHNNQIKKKCDYFKKTFGMKEPEEIRDSMTENLLSMLSVLEGVRNWFMNETNQLGEVTLDESRLKCKKKYDWKNEVALEIPDVEDIPLVESDDIHHSALNCLKVIINHLSCSIQEMRDFKDKLQKMSNRMEWSLDINTVYVFEVDKRIKSIVARISERLDDECEFMALISRLTKGDLTDTTPSSEKLSSNKSKSAEEEQPSSSDNSKTALSKLDILNSLKKMTNPNDFENPDTSTMPGKPESADCYLKTMDGMVDSVTNIIRCYTCQNNQMKEKCDIFEKSFGMKTPVEICDSMNENLWIMLFVLEGVRDWFIDESNQLCEIILDDSRQMNEKKYNWRNEVALDIADVEDIPSVDSDDIHHRALNCVKVTINHLSCTIQEMRYFKDKLRKMKNRMEWSLDINTVYVFDVDKRIKSFVFKITERLDKECEFMASICEYEKGGADTKMLKKMLPQSSSPSTSSQSQVKTVVPAKHSVAVSQPMAGSPPQTPAARPLQLNQRRRSSPAVLAPSAVPLRRSNRTAQPTKRFNIDPNKKSYAV